MLLALEVDHGHRQRVRQLATRRGERGRDQDDRPTPGEWGGKDAGADVQRVDKIDTAATTPHRGKEGEDSNDPTQVHSRPPPTAAAAVVVPRLPGVRNRGVGQTRRGRCCRWLQTDSHRGTGVRGTRGKSGSADTGDTRRQLAVTDALRDNTAPTLTTATA